MTLEDANAQLNKLLLSNEHYVGEFSGIVMSDNDNFTIDKETVTVSLSKMNLSGKMIATIVFRVWFSGIQHGGDIVISPKLLLKWSSAT